MVEVLARAFFEDPLVSWIVPDEPRRLPTTERAFTYFGRKFWFRHDEGYTTDSIAGAALWLPPGAWKVGPIAQLLMLPGMARSIGLRNFPRLYRYLDAAEKKHPHQTHFYLPIIGVSPDWQGRGIGTALLRPMLERCDRERMPAYLEATAPRNRACYERNGFEVTEEVRMADDAPPWWAMWREPT